MCGMSELRLISPCSETAAPEPPKGITREGFDMLMKIGGLARALAIVLAVVAGFVALNMMDVPLVLVVLGIIAGLAMTEDRILLSTATVIALPIIGTALTHIPSVGDKLNADAQPAARHRRRARNHDRHPPLSHDDGRSDGPRWRCNCWKSRNGLVRQTSFALGLRCFRAAGPFSWD